MIIGKYEQESVKRLLVFKEKFVEEEGEVQEDKVNIKLRNSYASDVSWAPSEVTRLDNDHHGNVERC
jgi:hypothetical protein